jgi:hypothetical protein
MNWYKRQLKIAKWISWTDDQIETIKNLVNEGKSFREIGRMFGVHPKSISILNDKHKWRDIKQERLDYDRRVAKMYRLPPYGEGMGVIEILNTNGINARTIYNVLRRLGLEEEIRDASYASKKRWQDPKQKEEQSLRKKKFYEEHPEVGKEHGEMMKQRYIDNPEMREDHGKKIKQRWDNDPDLKKRQSDRIKKTYEENPQLRENKSRQMKEWWKQFEDEHGKKLENRLLYFDSRQKAINLLNGFVGSKYQTDSDIAMAIKHKYLQIINDHTYPDEVQQPQTV